MTCQLNDSTISEQAKSNIDEIEQELETIPNISSPTRQDLHDQNGSTERQNIANRK